MIYNLGVAHGTPGVIAILGRVLAADVADDLRNQARSLLEGTIAWLLAQELPADSLGCFAWAIGRGIPREPARLAWCYGDPGIAVSLLIAGKAAREPTWEQAGQRIAFRAAVRPPASAQIQDAGLCHGTAGVGHLFHRLWQMTGNARLRDAARYWFGRALEMHRPGRGFAGFSVFLPAPGHPPRWCAEPGLLMGAAGVTLALVTATIPTIFRWDRALLLS